MRPDSVVGFVLDWCTVAVIIAGAWCFACNRLKARNRRAATPAPKPEPRDWYCTDGQMRTEAEAAAWVAETNGSLAEWLAVWPTSEEPLYVPNEWVA